MSKYIEADALFKWYEGQRTKYPIKGDSPQFGTLMMYEIFDEIEDAPSIDIVFCKECIFADFDEEAEMYRCGLVNFPHWNDDEHFCSYGEREGKR